MKKARFIAILLAIGLAALMSACASNAKSASGAEPVKSVEKKSQPATQETPPPPATASAEEVGKTVAVEKAIPAPATPEQKPVASAPEPEPVAPVPAPAPAPVEASKGTDLSTFEIVHFNFDKYDILPEYRDGLAKEAEILKGSGTRIVIEGHCDERGSAEYNMALGDRRANSVKRYLVSLGVDKKQIGTISYGEERPADPGHNEKAWRLNRRTQFTLAE